jgi:murein DD-endopeptidase MepM/ murein hydrolase activator NlpD
MKLRPGFARIVLLVGTGYGLSAAEPAGFDGVWSLDRQRSSALPPGMEQTMTIATEDEGLRVKTTIVTDFGDRVQDDRYLFDDAEHDVATPGVGSGTRKATRAGAREFTAMDRLMGANGETRIERHWSLAEGATELVIDLVSEGFSGRTQTRRVFTRGERAGPADTETSRLFPIDLRVPVAPSPFRQEGKLALVYEVELKSFRAGDLEWQRLDVLDEGGRQLASYEGDALAGILARPGASAGQDQPRRIPAGTSAVAYLWLVVDGTSPRALRHRVSLSLPAAGAGALRVVESGPVAVGAPAIVIGPPARGRGWVARWISNESFHRRGLFPVDGRAQIAQRFAIDWNRYDEQGIEQSGDASHNDTYSVYGQEVIAVADAVVDRALDGVQQNSPPNVAPGLGFDPDKALGNSVVLALPGGLFATYAHMQPGSLKVKTGDHVRRGQLLGLVGNSGNATGPHLHFHVATGPGLSGEGVPYVIDAFDQVGAEAMGDEGPVWHPEEAKAIARHAELPAEHSVVAFD